MFRKVDDRTTKVEKQPPAAAAEKKPVMEKVPGEENQRVSKENEKVSHPHYFQMIKYMEDKHKWFHGWVCNLSFPIQFIFATASGAVQGGAIGALYGTLAKLKAVHNPIPSEVFVSACIQARDFSALMATDGAMSCVGERITGKDDIQARKRSGADAIICGAIFAAWHGILYKEGPLLKVLTSSQPPVMDDTCYTKTKCMLSNLGLQYYEKNFKKNLLTDNAMHLLKESDFKDAEIPPGPRALILDYIQRLSSQERERGQERERDRKQDS
ncbi:hypothetical protein MKW98_032078 [Papaver atlanticum]|uniref:Uncharacterized protein n=1 Tax=Papaver atlanticum TaxID=357466 RepID=A0AAD4SF98_9MAGN|nr:hypothetical protein MKW98_032078 [Papaver atlanticum]